MKEIKFTKLKTLDGYNVEIGEHVVGRFAPFSPGFSFDDLIWVPKSKQIEMPEDKYQESFKIGDCILNGPAMLFSYKGEEIYLSSKRFQMMYHLCSNRGRCISRDEFSLALYGERAVSNIVDVHLKDLRRVLQGKVVIETIRGEGYRLR